MSKVKNATELNVVLAETLENVLSDQISTVKTKNIVSVADKLNRNNANTLDYKRITQHNRELSFFEK